LEAYSHTPSGPVAQRTTYSPVNLTPLITKHTVIPFGYVSAAAP
jgi:hypothetical protein